MMSGKSVHHSMWNRAGAWLGLAAMVAGATFELSDAALTVALPAVSGTMDGVNPLVLTLPVTVTTGTESFNTEGFAARFGWTATGTTWSGNPFAATLLTTGTGFTVVNSGTPQYLYQPVNPVGNIVVQSGTQRNLDISTITAPFYVPVASSILGTVQVSVDPDVRFATFTFGFDTDPVQFGFTESDSGDFNIIPYSNGGGVISLVPEPGSAIVVAASLGMLLLARLRRGSRRDADER